MSDNTLIEGFDNVNITDTKEEQVDSFLAKSETALYFHA